MRWWLRRLIGYTVFNFFGFFVEVLVCRWVRVELSSQECVMCLLAVCFDLLPARHDVPGTNREEPADVLERCVYFAMGVQ